MARVQHGEYHGLGVSNEGDHVPGTSDNENNFGRNMRRMDVVAVHEVEVESNDSDSNPVDKVSCWGLPLLCCSSTDCSTLVAGAGDVTGKHF